MKAYDVLLFFKYNESLQLNLNNSTFVLINCNEHVHLTNHSI